MIAYAAIDLRGGRVVQLVGGRPEEERINLPDPGLVARQWADAGFAALHVVDLDAALGTGENRAGIEAVLGAVDVPVQVGGGVRDEAGVAALLELGAARVVVGTRAVQDAEWRRTLAERYPGRVIVAADVLGEEVMVQGWTARSGLLVKDLLTELATLPLAGVLVTDVGREGRMAGADVARFRSLARASAHPLLASGGVADERDLERLAAAQVAGVVLGMALYTGAVDARSVARTYGK